MEAYLVINRVTGLRYIGITSQVVRNRWLRHVSAALRNVYATALHDAIRKYGRDAFDIQILKSFDSYEAMRDAERQLIQEYNTLIPHGYNMTIGGQGTVGYKWTEEAKSKLSEKTKGRSMAHAIAASNKVTKGQPLSEEHRKKIGASHLGKKNGPHSIEHRAKISAAHRGMKRSEDTCRNIAVAQRKIWNSKPLRCQLYSPQGELTDILDLRVFCRERKLELWKMKRVLSGTRVHCDGWRKSLDRTDLNKKSFSLISPQGERIDGIGLRGFALERGLAYHTMKRLLVGKCNEYKGWRRAI